ncbi:hypothetical protein EVAR_89674_1 [Eumeta japonica]|uniref:Uncharacterized protein n=1 Tax=Eumeta variegata TaxID=151549 RepID=A0A4C1Y9H6_EUMVA|nr:hypothetical protein EVAR_89674_1 [Eumeta japonica]
MCAKNARITQYYASTDFDDAFFLLERVYFKGGLTRIWIAFPWLTPVDATESPVSECGSRSAGLFHTFSERSVTGTPMNRDIGAAAGASGARGCDACVAGHMQLGRCSRRSTNEVNAFTYLLPCSPS